MLLYDNTYPFRHASELTAASLYYGLHEVAKKYGLQENLEQAKDIVPNHVWQPRFQTHESERYRGPRLTIDMPMTSCGFALFPFIKSDVH